MLEIENWNITSLTGKEHELVEVNNISWMLQESLRLSVVAGGGNSSLSALSQQSLPRLKVDTVFVQL